MPARPLLQRQSGAGQAGLTLIELVVAIVVIAVASTAVMLLLTTGFRSSADPQLRIKAVELGQSYMDEVFAKAFADPDGDDTESNRESFDDVEDYDGLAEGQACGDGPLLNAQGNARSGRYSGYCVEVAVTASAGDLVNVDGGDAWRIDVTVTDPQGNATPFTAYRLDI